MFHYMKDHKGFNEIDDVLKTKSRQFEFVLYPDNPRHCDIVHELNRGHMFVGILHDKDVNENGDPVKPHWHCLLKFKSPRWGRAVVSEFGVDTHLCRRVRDWASAELYLTHTGFPDKHQYDTDELFGPLTTECINLHEGQVDENARIKALFALIDAQDRHINVRDLVLLACDNQQFGDLMRLSSILRDLCEIHNENLTVD